MAIYQITGKPGSGKTYYVMNHLLRKYFSYDNLLKEWFPKGDFAVITNIENIKLNCNDFSEMIKVAGGIEKFFTVEYQKILLKRFVKIIYIIDEAGEFLGRGLKDEKCIFFFQYHRHLGLDFYLISPTVTNVNREIIGLSEYVVHARSRSSRVLSNFVYDKLFEGEKAGSVSLPVRKEVFRLYRSMEKEEGEHIGSFSRRYVVFAFAACLLAIVFFFGSIRYLNRGAKKASTISVPKVSEVKKDIRTEDKKGVVLEPLKQVVVDRVDDNGRDGVGDLDLSNLEEDYIRVNLVRGEGDRKIMYTEDGRLIPSILMAKIMNEGLMIGNQIYMRRGGGFFGKVIDQKSKLAPVRAGSITLGDPAVSEKKKLSVRNGTRVSESGNRLIRPPKHTP